MRALFSCPKKRTMIASCAGKSVVLTGAGGGIGRAIALSLTEAGANVAGTDRNEDGLNQTRDEVMKANADAKYHHMAGDISDGAFVDALFSDTVDRFGHIDHLVNCAGILRGQPILDMTEDEWDSVLRINLKAPFLTTKAFAAHAKETGSDKDRCIVNISSVAAKAPVPGHSNYAASKAGLVSFTKTSAAELAPMGIRVNAILPGVIKTPMVSDELMAAFLPQVPMGRVGRPDEIGSVVAFLLSDKATYATGGAFEISGGVFM